MTNHHPRDASTEAGGHVYVVAGDLARLQCDAWLLPTNERFYVTHFFGAAVGLAGGGILEGLSWGDRRAIPHGDPPDGPPWIWLGDVGRSGADTSWYADCAREFVMLASEAVRNAQTRTRPPLLAVNVLGSGYGGKGGDKGPLQRDLLPALFAAARDASADVVLVTWGRAAYSAAQRVRQQLLDERHVGQRDAMWDLGDGSLYDRAKVIAEQARRGNLVLFMGAGVSAGAGLPAWQGLLDDLAELLGDRAPDIDALHRLDFRDQATILAKRLAEQGLDLGDQVRQRFETTGYGLTHALLASLPTREAVTTNYDGLFEVAVEATQDKIRVLPHQAARPGGRWLLKLHGTVDQTESIVLTRRDYLGTPTSHGALFGVVQAMLMTRHMLFVGYSLSDEDFHQLMHEVRSALPDPSHLGTSVTLFDDPLFAELWEDLTVIPMSDPLAEPPTEPQLEHAARRLQIFLDLVGFEAADLTAFLLNDDYTGMLNERELALKQALAPLTREELPDGAGWTRVQNLLKGFGIASGDDGSSAP